jgi:hypothetical protein
MVKARDSLDLGLLLNDTWSAPTTMVEVMNAHTTPIAKAMPNVVSGGSGEIMFDKKAATVVITAKESGTDSLAQALSQDSAGSGYCSRKALLAR